MREKAISARAYRELLLADPYRPTYHFAVPDGCAMPGDPNGAFYADGTYHLMYLYRNLETERYQWGHMSSHDLLHWRQHPDALTAADGDEGCYSGGCYLDEDGTAYLVYWKLTVKASPKEHPGGIAIAYAGPPYEKWEEMEQLAVEATERGIRDEVIGGKTVHLCCADPSNIWKANGRYYMQLGNLTVLNRYGRGPEAPWEYRGGWTELYRSEDLRHWEYVHRFYEIQRPGEDWPDETEDDMCPSFLPLFDARSGGQETGKWLQLFISHNRGCQYFVGTLEGERFLPELHGRMSWKDKAYFAPEALIDGKKRHLIWTWLLDNLPNDFERFGWSGVYAFPREVWWENGTLRMAPAEELERLQFGHRSLTAVQSGRLPVRDGASFRAKGVWRPGTAAAGLRVRVNGDGTEYTEIYADREAKTLVMDTSRSGTEGWKVREEAPFSLAEEETLCLDIFVDHSVIEVYANERQAICRRVYPTDPADAVGVELIGEPEALLQLDIWEMAPANMY